MKYTIHRALNKLWNNRIIYLFLLIELSIGISVTLCGHLSSRSAQKRLDEYYSQFEIGEMVVEYYSKGNIFETAITYDDYSYLKQNYGMQYEFTYFLYTNSIFQLCDSNEVENVTILAMNKDAFSSLFGFEQQERIYVGSEISEALALGDIVFPERWIEMSEHSVRIGDHSISNIERIPKGFEKLITRAIQDFDLDVNKLMILPESLINTLEEESVSLVSFLMLQQQTEEKSDQIALILEELSRRHIGYSYAVVDLGIQIEQFIADLTQEIRLLSWVSKITLVITTLGIIGVLFLFLQFRRREYAIALTQGATHQMIFRELYCEVLILNGLAGIVGILIAVVAIPYLSTSMFTTSFSLTVIPIVIAIILIITFSVCISILFCIRSIYPSKLLRT